jgi:hypothetical protein
MVAIPASYELWSGAMKAGHIDRRDELVRGQGEGFAAKMLLSQQVVSGLDRTSFGY